MQSSTADFIDQLPTDQSSATQEEIQIVDTIFKSQNPQKVQRLVKEFKDALLVLCLIFFILCFKTHIENIICRYLPKIGSSQLLVNLLVASLAGFIFYFSKNLNSIKKKTS